MRITKKNAIKLLAKAGVIRVATVSRRGMPQVTPVCHAVYKGKIYFSSEPDSQKVKNIRRKSLIALVADKYTRNWRNMGGVLVQGRARLLSSGPLFKKVSQLLYQKYPPYYPEEEIVEGESMVIEVTPVNVFYWWYD